MPVAAPELIQRTEALMIHGLGVRTRNSDEADPATARISALWQRFYAEGLATKAGAPVFGVYAQYESDAQGAYTLVIGSPHLAGAKPDLQSVAIPAGTYLEFVVSGPLPAIVVTGWEAVWRYFEQAGSPHRSYQVDYECYDPSVANQMRIGIGIVTQP